MIFDGTFSYLIRNADLHGLSRYNHANITDDDFTILAKVIPNWYIELNADGVNTGYIVCKNGMHIGIYFMKSINSDGECFEFGCAYCTELEGNVNFNYIKIEINNLESEYNVSMVHNKNDKSVSLYVNDVKKTELYQGNIIDYSNSWVWVGAACGTDAYDERYSYFYNGDIKYVGIFKKAFNDMEISNIITDGKIVDYNSQYWPIFISNFEETTPYKVRDQSNAGNNLIIYNNEWV
jgi:hypothetical protein